MPSKKGLSAQNGAFSSAEDGGYKEFYCSRCGIHFDGPCPTHSLHIPDAEVVPFALASLPDILDFILPGPHELPKGVRARRPIPEQTILGPVRGILCSHTENEEVVYAAPDPLDCTSIKRFHMESVNVCNWTKFLQPASDTRERNVAVFASENEVYFLTTRNIASDEELKVFYSRNYAKLVGIEYPVAAGTLLAERKHNAGDQMLLDETADPGSFLPEETECDRQSTAQSVEETDHSTTDVDFSVLIPSAPKHSADHEARELQLSGKALEKRIKRLRAVVQENPYQFFGKERTRAWECAVELFLDRLLPQSEMDRARDSMQKAVRHLAQSYYTSRERLLFVEGKHPVLQQYVDLMEQIIRMESEKIVQVAEKPDKLKKKAESKKKPQIKKVFTTKASTDGIHPCTECGVSFASEELLALHSLGHNPIGVADDGGRVDLDCPECRKGFANVTGLVAHVAQHQRVYMPRIQCDHCRHYIQACFFPQHLQNMHSDIMGEVVPASEHICEKCGKDLITRKRLTSHKTSAHGAWRCMYCAQIFDHGKALGRHALSHREADGFHCPECSSLQSTYPLLSRHFRGHHLGAVRACSVCNKIFKNISILRKHMSSHSEEINQECGICGKRFKNQKAVRKHTRWSHGTFQKERYKQQKEIMPPKSYTPIRKRMQYEEFPYKCEECRVGFVRQGRWVRHRAERHAAE